MVARCVGGPPAHGFVVSHTLSRLPNVLNADAQAVHAFHREHASADSHDPAPCVRSTDANRSCSCQTKLMQHGLV